MSLLKSLTESSSTPKTLARKVFTLQEGTTDTFNCVCGSVRKQNVNSGYSNLLLHIHRHQADHKRLQSNEAQVLSSTQSFFSKETIEIYSWLDLTISILLSFSICERKVVGRHVNSDGISVETSSGVHGGSN